MPRLKHSSMKKCYTSSQSDITLKHYADAESQKLKVSKGAANAIHNEVRNMQMTTIDKTRLEKEDVSWFDKDIDDLEIGEPVSEELEDIDQNQVQRYQRRKRESFSGGIRFPIDLWVALSCQILPEQILTFAQICWASNAVVHTVRFWKHLYNRFYFEKSELPECLRIENLERINGLRQRVIRSLFYIYPPFVAKIKRTMPLRMNHIFLLAKDAYLLGMKK